EEEQGDEKDESTDRETGSQRGHRKPQLSLVDAVQPRWGAEAKNNRQNTPTTSQNAAARGSADRRECCPAPLPTARRSCSSSWLAYHGQPWCRRRASQVSPSG